MSGLRKNLHQTYLESPRSSPAKSPPQTHLLVPRTNHPQTPRSQRRDKYPRSQRRTRFLFPNPSGSDKDGGFSQWHRAHSIKEERGINQHRCEKQHLKLQIHLFRRNCPSLQGRFNLFASKTRKVIWKYRTIGTVSQDCREYGPSARSGNGTNVRSPNNNVLATAVQCIGGYSGND